MKTFRALIALVLLAPLFASAHRDIIFSLRSDGSIPELPVEYSGTRVRISFSTEAQPALTSFIFISGGKETVLTACLLKLVRTNDLGGVRLTGSWYHDEMTLPPYVSIRFTEPNNKGAPWAVPGVYFLFSLRDASLLSVEHVTFDLATETEKRSKIEMSDQCPTAK